jgi:internalin A
VLLLHPVLDAFAVRFEYEEIVDVSIMTERKLLSLIAHAGEEEWEELDLAGLDLTTLPPEIGGLVKLKRLILGRYDEKRLGNKLTDLPEEISKLTSLEKLAAPYNLFTTIPKPIEKLRNLRSLYLSYNQINAIPATIRKLQKLQSLDLSHNQITTIPDTVERLQNLQSLNLTYNQIVDIPEVIGGLQNMQSLELNDNQIIAILHTIGNLYNLQRLDLSNNSIAVVPEEIGKLRKLLYLSLEFNSIEIIPNTVGSLTSIIYLILNNNQIKFIPETIGNLQNLQEFYISENDIEDIPVTINKLQNLRNLHLSSNQIKIISRMIGDLENLQGLDLSNNQIKSIPSDFQKLVRLKRLELINNPLDIPPEILLSENAQSIFKYYFATKDKSKIKIIYETKLLLVGEGEAGKTSLARKILDSKYQLQPTDATQGIDIFTWEFEGRNGQEYRINIWDFGGQSIYHQTHRFFLTQRSLYLLVSDSRKEDTDHYWWLQNIQIYGQESPVLLIQNEKNNCASCIDYLKLRKDFINLKDTYKINLADNRGLQQLKMGLQYELENLIGAGLSFPNTWVAVRQDLTADHRKYIDISEYKSICQKQSISDEGEMLSLSQLLHDLGVFLHFQDPKSILYRQIILDRKWGTDAVYKILTNDKVKTNFGHFNDQDLHNIWKETDESNQRYELLELMKKFKVCYEIPRRQGEYIAPHLLANKSKEYDWPVEEPPLILHYSYKDFMPKGMMTRFIVEMHRDIENVSEPDRALAWKNGVVLKRDNVRVELIEHYPQRLITIRAIGSRARNLINIVHHEFQKIHTDFNLQPTNYQVLIPCNCSTCLNTVRLMTKSR